MPPPTHHPTRKLLTFARLHGVMCCLSRLEKKDHALFGTPSLVTLLTYGFCCCCRRFALSSHGLVGIFKSFGPVYVLRDSERRILEGLVTTSRLSSRRCVCDSFLGFADHVSRLFSFFFLFSFSATHMSVMLWRERICTI